MNSSEQAFREKFIRLVEARNKQINAKEQLTSEDESDNIVGLGEATE